MTSAHAHLPKTSATLVELEIMHTALLDLGQSRQGRRRGLVVDPALQMEARKRTMGGMHHAMRLWDGHYGATAQHAQMHHPLHALVAKASRCS